MARRGKRTKPLIKPFPKGKQLPWSKQKLFMKLSDFNQELSDPYLFGETRSIYGVAKFSTAQ